MKTITLDRALSVKQASWLYQNVGHEKYWIHNKIGGDGWHAEMLASRKWTLTFDDDKMATMFLLKWS